MRDSWKIESRQDQIDKKKRHYIPKHMWEISAEVRTNPKNHQ